MPTFRSLSAGLALSCLAPAALAHVTHHHLTVDTAGGQTVIRAGYLAEESHLSIDETGRVLDEGAIAVFELEDVLGQPGEFHGWAVGDPLVLTSDFFFATGRLAGGDFAYEIAAVTPAAGAAWGFVHAGVFEGEARSGGATREDRSLVVGAGGHAHGQYLALGAAGVFDVTLLAWDRNGVYADSTPVTFRVSTLAALCPADLTGDGVVDFGDYLEFLNLFDAQDARVDFTLDGVVDFGDYLEFLNLYERGCS